MAALNMTKYNVGGVAWHRPFKIRRLGHFGFNASDLEASRHFYFDLLGFFITEPAGAGFFRSARGRSSLLRPVRKEKVQRATIRRAQRQAFSAGE